MKRFLLLISVLFFLTNNVFAYDWKYLHERADKENLSEALGLVKSGQGSIENQYLLGLIYLNLYKNLQAEEVFNKILNTDKQMLGAKWGVAEAYRRQHKQDAARKILDEVLKVDPQFPPACISLAYIKYMNMKFEESVKLALRVIEQGRDKVDSSNYVRAYTMYAGAKGMIAHYGGFFSKAINGLAVKSNLDKAERLSPNAVPVLFGLGSYYFLAPLIAGGDKVKAEAYFKRVIEVDPMFVDAYVRLAQLYKVRGVKEKYNFYMNKAIELDPENELILDSRSGECKFICVGGKD
jgi:tetratricopeptide (TPR) repeat protein